jgi:hypothetical protein
MSLSVWLRLNSKSSTESQLAFGGHVTIFRVNEWTKGETSMKCVGSKSLCYCIYAFLVYLSNTTINKNNSLLLFCVNWVFIGLEYNIATCFGSHGAIIRRYSLQIWYYWIVILIWIHILQVSSVFIKYKTLKHSIILSYAQIYSYTSILRA